MQETDEIYKLANISNFYKDYTHRKRYLRYYIYQILPCNKSKYWLEYKNKDDQKAIKMF